jgi:phytoene synthase
MTETDGALSAPAALLRRLDHDRFLAAMLAPSGAREDVFAVQAVHAELAKTRFVVSEPMMGRIRLQWWRDAIAALFNSPDTAPRHELIQPLGRAIARHGLPREPFLALIDAREDELAGEEPDEAAIEALSAPAFRLSALCLGPASPALDEAVRHAALGCGLSDRLRDLARRGVARTDVAAVAARALGHIDAARASVRKLPKAQRRAFLSTVVARLYLGRLERAGWDLRDPRFGMRHPRRLPQMLWELTKITLGV